MKIFKKVLSIILALYVTSPFITECKYELDLVRAADTNVMYGDVNNDNQINILDLIKTKSYISKDCTSEFNEESADVNADGDVSVKDVLEISYFLLNQIESFSYEVYIDSDKDGLCDYIENEILNTDSKKKDTDEDGLDDYSEIYLCNTSPIENDTGNTGLEDDLKDIDKDKLTNIEEILFGSSPLMYDTDADGVNDYDEVKTYNTLPYSTNNTKEIIANHFISSDNVILKEINNNNAYELSISINASSNFNTALMVKKSVYTNYIMNGECRDAVLGKIVDVTYSDSETLENLRIEFKVENENPAHYMIFKFFEDVQTLLPISTNHSDNNVIYAIDNSPGTYALIDLKVWYKDFENRINKTDINQLSQNKANPIAYDNSFIFYNDNNVKEVQQNSKKAFPLYGRFVF